MHYCPNCRKKFREYRRKCPICGGPCRHNDNSTIFLIIGIGVLFAVLIGLIILLLPALPSPDTETTAPSESVTTLPTIPSESGTIPSSQPTEPSTVPTEPPTTAPTVPPSTAPSGIGMYTRAELEALDNKSFGYGPGPNRDYLNFRPEYAVGDQKRHEKYGANFIAPDNGNIYLTFDCGYEYYTTDSTGKKVPVTSMILDVLKEKNVKGVFFITMAYAKSEPDLVRRMINEGHAVGNHTNNHPVMPTLSIDEMEYEIMSLHDYVKENFGYTMNLFRFPTGEYSVRALAVVQNLGYKSVHWSFAYADYTPENQPDVKTSLQNVLNKSHSGAIYLLHAVSVTNATILGDAIDGFQEKGFKLELFQ